MSSFRINFPSVQTFNEQLAGTTKTIQSSLEEMDANLQQYLSTWEGTTVDAYNNIKAQWNAALAQMQHALDAGNTTIANISDNFQTTERGLTSSWQ